MIERRNYATIAASLILLLLSCSKHTDPVQRQAGVEMLKGEARFYEEVAELSNPTGVVAQGAAISGDNIVKKDPTAWDEFFIFDKNTSLVILSWAPTYFIKIQSEGFHFQLTTEFNQIKDGKSGSNKTINHLPSLKDVGDYKVEIYFTPRELSFSGTTSTVPFRINQVNSQHKPREDVWRFYDAAANVWFYSPNFMDKSIHEDFAKSAYERSQHRMIWTQTAPTYNNPVSHNLTAENLNFTFMLGTDLTLTENLLDGEVIHFQDEFELTRDFAAFFSMANIGNSQSSTGQDHLENNDSVAVVIRGDMKRFINWMKNEGFNLDEKPARGLRLTLTDQKPNLLVGLSEASTINLHLSTDGGSTYGAAIPLSQATSYTHTLTAATRGYQFVAQARTTGGAVIATTDPLWLYTDELKITEIMWMGTLDNDGIPDGADDDDEFIEVKNITSGTVSLATVKICENGSDEDTTITGSVGAGEYYVFYFGTADLFSSTNLPLLGTNSQTTSISLGKSSTIELRRDSCSSGQLIDSLKYTESKGEDTVAVRKSAVLPADSIELRDSTYDLGNIGITNYAGKTFATPGFSLSTEF